MMKKWGAASLLFFLLSVSALAENSNEELYTPGTFFITHEQFMSLTPAEQLTYVKKIREVIVEMAETFPYFTEEMSARSSLFQQLWTLNIPEAQSDEAPNPKSGYDYVAFSLSEANSYLKEIKEANSATLSDQQKQELISKYRQAMYWTSIAAREIGPLPKTKYKTQRNRLMSDIRKTTTEIDNFEKKIIAISPKQDDSEFKSVRDNYLKKALAGQLSSKAEIPTRNHPSAKDKKGSAQKETSLKDPESAMAGGSAPVEPNKAQTSEPAEFNMEKPLYRCMYAGFVIKKDPCMAPRTLPWDLKPLDKNTFVCASGTIMCNPLVFGLKTECDQSSLPEKCLSGAKPYCVKPDREATKNCAKMSNNTQSLQATVDLIKANKAVSLEFGKSFQDLCYNGLIDYNSYPRKRTEKNKQRTRDDIKKTCKVANERIQAIKKHYNLDSSPADAKKMTSPPIDAKQLTSPPSNAPQGKDLLMKKSNSNSGKQ